MDTRLLGLVLLAGALWWWWNNRQGDTRPSLELPAKLPAAVYWEGVYKGDPYEDPWL